MFELLWFIDEVVAAGGGSSSLSLGIRLGL